MDGDDEASVALSSGEASTSNRTLLNLGLTVLRNDVDKVAQKKQSHILIVGDGDLSYSVALCRSLQLPKPDVNLIATTYDSEEELRQRYISSPAAIRSLREQYGATVMTKVDATQLNRSFSPGAVAFDRIVFNYPYYPPTKGNRNKIHKHRQLLANFFSSAETFLASGGEIWVTLAPGQGGTPAELESERRETHNHWQILENAALASLVLVDVHHPPIYALSELGYYCTGFRLRQKGFRVNGSLTHVFCRQEETRGRPSLYALVWQRDCCFMVDDSFHEDSFIQRVRRLCGPNIMVSWSPLSSYVDPRSGVRTLGYHFTFRSSKIALCKTLANYLADTIASAETDRFLKANKELAALWDIRPPKINSIPSEKKLQLLKEILPPDSGD